MAASTAPITPAEFSVDRTWQPDHRSPTRWLLSHLLRYKLYIVGVFVGAFGNGIGAGLLFMHIGWAFNAIVEGADVVQLGWICLSLVTMTPPSPVVICLLG